MMNFLISIIISITDPVVIVGGIASGWLWNRSERNGAIALVVSVVILLIVDISSAYMLGGRLTPRLFGFMAVHCAALGIWTWGTLLVARRRARGRTNPNGPPSSH